MLESNELLAGVVVQGDPKKRTVSRGNIVGKASTSFSARQRAPDVAGALALVGAAWSARRR